MNIMSIEESQSIFFDNIRRLRKQRGQSLEALAKESGLPLDMLAQLEQNVRIMDNVLRFLCVRKDEA